MILKLNGFTLAEVLITLGIIGVVAALTIPNVIAEFKERQSIVALKKITSELSQVNMALNSEYSGNWTYECSSFDDKCFRDMFASRIKTIKICDKPIEQGCQANSLFLNKKTTEASININYNWPGVITYSGYSIKFRFHIQDCNSSNSSYNNLCCGWVQVDINGLKAPNVVVLVTLP